MKETVLDGFTGIPKPWPTPKPAKHDPPEPNEPKPKDAERWGFCKGCEEWHWLFKYEGTYTDPNDLMCEGCIDEYHDSVHDAEEAMTTEEEATWEMEEPAEPDEGAC